MCIQRRRKHVGVSSKQANLQRVVEQLVLPDAIKLALQIRDYHWPFIPDAYWPFKSDSDWPSIPDANNPAAGRGRLRTVSETAIMQYQGV